MNFTEWVNIGENFPFFFSWGFSAIYNFFNIYFILLLKRKCCPICQLQTLTRCFRLSEKLKNIKLSTWALQCSFLVLFAGNKKKTYWKCCEAPSMKNGVISVVLSIHIYLYAFMLFKYWCIDVGVQLCFKQIWIQTKIAVWVVWFFMYRYPTPHAKNHSAYFGAAEYSYTASSYAGFHSCSSTYCSRTMQGFIPAQVLNNNIFL